MTELAAPHDTALYATDQWLSLTGPDAAAFAQAQFCSDVAALSPGAWQFSAWLDAQGRVRAFFHLLRSAPDAFHLLLRGGRAAALVEPLQRFVFRAKLRIAAAPPAANDLPADATPAAGPQTFVVSAAQVQLQASGIPLRAVLAEGAVLAADAALAEIRAGLPRLPNAALAELLPAWLDFERLGAISFRKGCYPGQEVAARMHFRGANSRHLQHVRVTGGTSDPSGLVVRRGDGAEAGRLLQAVAVAPDAFEALAVLRDGSGPNGLGLEFPAPRPVEVLSAQWRAPN